MQTESLVLERKIEYLEKKGDPVIDLKEGFFEIPSSTKAVSDLDTLAYLLKGSPKLRELLPIIRDEVLRLNKKSIVWCNWSIQV